VPFLFAREWYWPLYFLTTTRFLGDDSETVDAECRVARRRSGFLFLSTPGKKGVR